MAIQKSKPVGGQEWDHQITPITDKKRKREDAVTLAAVECMQSAKKKTPKTLEDRAEIAPRNPGTTKLFKQRADKTPRR